VVYVLDVLQGPAWLSGALLATSTGLSSVLGVRVVMLLVALFAVSSRLPWTMLVAAAFVALGVQRALAAMVPPELDRAG
jgi:hypothetical protein